MGNGPRKLTKANLVAQYQNFNYISYAQKVNRGKLLSTIPALLTLKGYQKTRPASNRDFLWNTNSTQSRKMVKLNP